MLCRVGGERLVSLVADLKAAWKGVVSGMVPSSSISNTMSLAGRQDDRTDRSVSQAEGASTVEQVGQSGRSLSGLVAVTALPGCPTL